MKPITFSDHSKLQMTHRGASENEVLEAIESGLHVPGKLGRLKAKFSFVYDNISPVNGLRYKYKTVDAVFIEEDKEVVVITVMVYYSNEG